MHFTTLLAAASASLLLPTIFASPVASSPAPIDLARRGEVLERAEAPHDLYLKDDDKHTIEGELEKAFSAIEAIPDAVLEAGDEATNNWMVENGYRFQNKKRDMVDRDLEDRDVFGVVKCAGAIAAFIASNAIGAAKLLRIKKYIEALGGIRKSAELLLKASNNAERLREGGEILALLAGEILGFSLIANNC